MHTNARFKSHQEKIKIQADRSRVEMTCLLHRVHHTQQGNRPNEEQDSCQTQLSLRGTATNSPALNTEQVTDRKKISALGYIEVTFRKKQNAIRYIKVTF